MEKGELERREKGLKLFGVRILGEERAGELEEEEAEEEVMRKSSSMGNLASCTADPAGDHSGGEHGYLSDGGLHQSSRRRRRRRRGGQERKKGVPWTEEEHRTFLAGLEKLGKGDWRGISRNFVITRTPTQVASHAQKYFLRQINTGKKKRRSSLFDVVVTDKAAITDSASASSPKKPHEAKEETNHLSLEKHMMEVPALVTTQVASRGVEASSVLPVMTSHGGITNFSRANLMGGISGGSAKEQVMPTLSLLSPLNIPGHMASMLQANSPACVPNLLKLSLPHCPSSATSSSVGSSDLELSIAPPQPQCLAKLSSQGVAGAIRVV